MAQFSNCKAMFLMVIAMVLVSVTAQDTAPAPSPALDAGAGTLVTISSLYIYSPVLFSLFALLRR
ncbi:PREDICTED: PRUPE_6G023500 [Prunus dulcis]|uniref:PREDICTED: PRUPE_6G023500 n=1 Tax=Prunus dulcis TaxID=3755 RepID=A0A5E4ETH5_PRUDU|nr:PREDICTED: PRUPE_6G023500 [Prunus dulcis]